MQLVENDELEPLGILDHSLVELALSRHQELEHHEIGRQDVGLGLHDLHAFVLVFLSGVPCEGRPQVFRQAGLVEKFVEFLALTVGQRIHRVDHDRPRARLVAGGAGADRCIDDRYEEAERFSRTGAGRDREALPSHGFRDGLRLMPVKGDRSPVDAKDTRHIRMERSISNERLDRGALLEMWVDGDQRLRPKSPALVDCIDLIADILGADLGERASEACVVGNEYAIQIKDIHDDYRSSRARTHLGPAA
jgi:hypothetical protein